MFSYVSLLGYTNNILPHASVILLNLILKKEKKKGVKKNIFPIGDFCCNFIGTVALRHVNCFVPFIEQPTKVFFFLVFFLALPKILLSLGPFQPFPSSLSLTSGCTANPTDLTKTSSWVILLRKNPHVPVILYPPCTVFLQLPVPLSGTQAHLLWASQTSPLEGITLLKYFILDSLNITNTGIFPKEANGMCAE